MQAGSNSKSGAIKCCKQILSPTRLNACRNIPFWIEPKFWNTLFYELKCDCISDDDESEEYQVQEVIPKSRPRSKPRSRPLKVQPVSAPVGKHSGKKKKQQSFTIRGSLVVIKGLACKSCKFHATHKHLMDSHLFEKHSDKYKPDQLPEEPAPKMPSLTTISKPEQAVQELLSHVKALQASRYQQAHHSKVDPIAKHFSEPKRKPKPASKQTSSTSHSSKHDTAPKHHSESHHKVKPFIKQQSPEHYKEPPQFSAHNYFNRPGPGLFPPYNYNNPPGFPPYTGYEHTQHFMTPHHYQDYQNRMNQPSYDPSIESESGDHQNDQRDAFSEHDEEDNHYQSTELLDLDYPQDERTNETTTVSESFACWFCKSTFATVDILNKHIQEFHYLNKDKSKDVKDVVPAAKRPLTETEKAKKKSPSEHCTICDEHFKSRRTYNDHMNRKHKPKILQCDQCEMTFSKRAMLTHHIRNTHTLRFLKCQFCYKVLSSIKTLTSHLLFVHDYRIKQSEQLIFAPPEEMFPQELIQIKEPLPLTAPSKDKVENPEAGDNNSSEAPTTTEKVFPCPSCNKFFVTKKKLWNHTILVHEEKTIMCQNCGDRFSRQYLLRKHIREVHDRMTDIPCPYCHDILSNEKTMYFHMRVMHKDKRYSCKFCSEGFGTKEDLKEHTNALHRDEIILRCDTCNQEFETNLRLIKHQIAEHNLKPYACNHCEQAFTTNQCLMKHIRRKHFPDYDFPTSKSTSNQEPIKCELCSKELGSGWHLRRHMVFRHSEPGSHNCKLCFKTMEKEEELKEHMATVHADLKLNCDICDKTFNNPWHLKRHNLAKHPELVTGHSRRAPAGSKSGSPSKSYASAPGQKVECEECARSFASSWHLKRHNSRFHDNDNVHFCTTCKKRFKTVEKLDDHICSTPESKKIPCEFCDAKLGSKWHLKRHMENKHDEKYPCDHCNREFKSKELLETHIQRKHEEEGAIQCEHCETEFEKKADLRSHMVSDHSDLLTISCDDCEEMYETNKQLKLHRKEAHKKEEPVKTRILQPRGTKTSFKCEFCNKKLESNSQLRRHTGRCPYAEYPCTICAGVFGTEDELAQHIEADHVEEENYEENEGEDDDDEDDDDDDANYIDSSAIKTEVTEDDDPDFVY